MCTCCDCLACELAAMRARSALRRTAQAATVARIIGMSATKARRLIRLGYYRDGVPESERPQCQ